MRKRLRRWNEFGQRYPEPDRRKPAVNEQITRQKTCKGGHGSGKREQAGETIGLITGCGRHQPCAGR